MNQRTPSQEKHSPLAYGWTDVWSRMASEERMRAIENYLALFHHRNTSSLGSYPLWFYKRFARQIHFRAETLRRMGAAKLANLLASHVATFFDGDDWQLLFQAHYLQDKQAIMCRFLDLCGIEHDEKGGVKQDAVSPPDDIEAITRKLVEAHGHDEVTRYFMMLRLHSADNWVFLDAVLPGLLSVEVREGGESGPETQVEERAQARELTDDFTQLDRVLIDQIISTAAGEERSLTPEELLDLVETVHALDTQRNRTYFHLGFMNALLEIADETFLGPEMNDPRRGWYLAGLLAGFARQRNVERIREQLQSCKDTFERVAGKSGGAGASMAKTVYPLLLESGQIHPAISLLKGQVREVGRSMADMTLAQASEMLRRDQVPEAKVLLDTLHDQMQAISPAERGQHYPEFLRAVQRKLGQAYQAGGELERARSLFEPLLSDTGNATPKLLADMGLLEAGFSGIRDVRIEGERERRQALLAALEKGRERFEEAVSRFQEGAHHAHYALAVMAYLRFMDGGDGEREDPELARQAIRHVRAALSGMIGSDEREAFDSLGITGQCRFMLAVLQMSCLDESRAQAAMQAWKAIPENAGRFPPDHLRRFLEWSEVTDRESAILIAESIWQTRGPESLELLRQQEWVVGSALLREVFITAAREPQRPRLERFELWRFLVPALMKANYLQLAEEGLDAMEELAESDAEIAGHFAEWLLERTHWDPAWEETDVLKARYRCLNRVGDSAATVAVLGNLFHAVKESSPLEAEEIRRLIIEHEGEAAASGLVIPALEESAPEEESDARERLENGESVTVLFIGGNETQARYDGPIREAIQAEWPGVRIHFEHTGWSSNWGHEVDKLRKLARASDAVVLMSMMRTLLGRTMRAALNDPPRPWVPCTGRGKQALTESIRRAAVVGLRERDCKVS